MLSGFSLYYVAAIKEQQTINSIGIFLKKRIIGIYPLYFITYVLFVVMTYVGVHFLHIQTEDYVEVLDQIIAAPVELSLLQSIYTGSFSFLHNGGTWFLSAILICYLIYPYIEYVVNNNNKRINSILFIILYLVSGYSWFFINRFNFPSIYTNPLLCFCEFTIGCLVCKSVISKQPISSNKIIQLYKVLVILLYLILIVTITFGVYYIGMNTEAYNFIAIIIFTLILYCSSIIDLSKNNNKDTYVQRIVIIFSENTYAFYLAQFFVWHPIKFLLQKKHDLFCNYELICKVFISFALCTVISLCFHYLFEIPIKRKFLKQ